MTEESTVRKMRLDKGWSQEHLAQLSGVSVRTIQRVERGKPIGLESLKCLAAVFETDVVNLRQEQTMTKTPHQAAAAMTEGAESYSENKRAFMLNAVAFIVVMPILYYFNMTYSPDELWVQWVALFWGVSFVLHAAVMATMDRGPRGDR